MASPVNLTPKAMDLEKTLRSIFSRERIPLTGVDPLNSFQIKAWDSFSKQSIPSRKVDAWKRVDLLQIPWQNYEAYFLEGSDQSSDWQIDEIKILTDLGVLAGTFPVALLHHPESVIQSIHDGINPDWDIFSAIPAAFASDGIFIKIPAGLVLKEPIHIRSGNNPRQARLFNHMIWLEAGAEAQVVLEDGMSSTGSSEPGVSMGNLGILLKEGSKLNLVEMTGGNDRSWNILHEKASLDAGAQLDWQVYTLDGRFNKQFIQADLNGQGSTVQMAGLYLPDGKQQVEFNTRQNHFGRDTKSNLLYKGVLLEESQSLFSGMIHVAPGAVKSDGYQANRNLIIGDNAHADTLPGLEILADDVRCTHGATVGKIDPVEQFYLQSRGLDREDAQKLVIQGFLDPVVQLLPGEPEKTRLQGIIERKLSKRA